MSSPSRNKLKILLPELRSRYTDARWIHPDPLEIVLKYTDLRDREVTALLASALAYGRVNKILESVTDILSRMENAPCRFVLDASLSDMRKRFTGFKHRFHTGEDVALLFAGVGSAYRKYGSLENCFLAGMKAGDSNVFNGAVFFSQEICRLFPSGKSTLLPSPADGSACKRLNLMLRWLVRRDNVDPGGWTGFKPSQLIVPLDTHMHRIALELHLTKRHAADWKTACEITESFAKIDPVDPVSFDFALTRFGIHPDLGRNPFPGSFRKSKAVP